MEKIKISEEQRTRLIEILKKAGILLVIGIVYYIFVRITGKGIPCLISLVTKKYCPGCGISRMFMSLASGNIAAAFKYNVLVMALLPFGIFFGIRRGIYYVKTGKSNYDIYECVALGVTFVLMVAFWIMRNIPYFSFLAPHA